MLTCCQGLHGVDVLLRLCGPAGGDEAVGAAVLRPVGGVRGEGEPGGGGREGVIPYPHGCQSGIFVANFWGGKKKIEKCGGQCHGWRHLELFQGRSRALARTAIAAAQLALLLPIFFLFFENVLLFSF